MRRVPYASTMESLMHAMLCTRLDTCYTIGILSRYQSNPGHEHWNVVKYKFKYLNRTKNYMSVYSGEDLTLIWINQFKLSI